MKLWCEIQRSRRSKRKKKREHKKKDEHKEDNRDNYRRRRMKGEVKHRRRMKGKVKRAIRRTEFATSAQNQQVDNGDGNA